MLRDVLEWYFTPKFFEKNGIIYEFFGVHIFKRFIPTFGDYMVRLTGSSLLSDGSTKSLKMYEKMTRIFETIHVIFCIAMINLFVARPTWSNFFMNMAINVYPIMTQRYNRMRIYRILQKREGKLTA